MPTPTPEMDDWIFSIYGKHPAWFVKGGGYHPSADAAPPGGAPAPDGGDPALVEMDLAFGGGPASAGGDGSAIHKRSALGEAVDWTKHKLAAGAHAVGAFDAAHGHVLTRAAGAAQMVGGAAEAVAGGALAGVGGAASGTGVGAAPGVPAMIGGTALAVNGADNAQTGLRTLVTGQFHHTAVSEGAGAAARALGASDQTAERITAGVDLTQGVAGGAGSVAAGMLRKGAGAATELSAAGRAGRAVEGGEDAAKALGKAGEIPHPPPPPPVLSGRALALSNALRDAPKGSPERARLIEEFAKESTHVQPPPTRVALGKWEKAGAGGYIDDAKAGGGVWYETPEGSYAVIGKDAAWETNVAFLRQQLESGIPKLEFTNIKIDKELAIEAERLAKGGDPLATPARVKEIQFLEANAPSYGYQRVGNSFIKTK